MQPAILRSCGPPWSAPTEDGAYLALLVGMDNWDLGLTGFDTQVLKIPVTAIRFSDYVFVFWWFLSFSWLADLRRGGRRLVKRVS